MIPDELRDERGRIKRQHGMSGTPEMTVWGGIVARCTRPWNIRWKDYGGEVSMLHWRVRQGWSAERCIEQPLRAKASLRGDA